MTESRIRDFSLADNKFKFMLWIVWLIRGTTGEKIALYYGVMQSNEWVRLQRCTHSIRTVIGARVAVAVGLLLLLLLLSRRRSHRRRDDRRVRRVPLVVVVVAADGGRVSTAAGTAPLRSPVGRRGLVLRGHRRAFHAAARDVRRRSGATTAVTILKQKKSGQEKDKTT